MAWLGRGRAGGAIKGRGWKYGSGFVDGVFPVLSPMAQDVLELVQTRGTDAASVWESLDKIPQAHDLWDDIVNVAVQLRLNRQWEPIITVSLSANRTAAPHTLAACIDSET